MKYLNLVSRHNRTTVTRTLANMSSSGRDSSSHSPFHHGSVPEPTREVEEVRIQFPWGHIAGKWWGNQNVRPILALHGWQDNAGTYDALAPLLPPHVGILALDLPGHGLSSRIPDSMFYSTIDAILLINLIKKEYNWDKVSLMGHSMSSIMCFVYCALFPQNVDLMIGIDALKPQIPKANSLIPRMRKQLEGFMVANERNSARSEPPAYTYEELVERLHKGTMGSITKEACGMLLQRSVSKSTKFPDKFFFHRDNRLKTFNFAVFNHEQVLEMVEQLTGIPYLFIKATKSPVWEERKYYEETKAKMLATNPKMEFRSVEGTHHLHLTHPESVSGIISEFINRIRPAAETTEQQAVDLKAKL